LPRGNPRQLHSVADLAKPGIRFVNRQAGSGTRVLTEHLLREAGMATSQLPDWDAPAEDSHLAVAAAVASGVADAAVGIEAAAESFGLDFIPLIEEDYFLVCLKDALDHPAVLKLRETLAGPLWRQRLLELPGYEANQAGEVLSLTRALPWWQYRRPKA
jgi:putative molybdopterin biosynthesis protein